MPKVKKQHYVPQFYLRNFSNDNKQIFVFDKFDKKIFSANIKNVGCQRYFYNTPLYVIAAAEELFLEVAARNNHKEILELLLTGNETIEEIEALKIAIKQPNFVQEALTTIRDEQFMENRLANFEGYVAQLFKRFMNDVDKYQVIRKKRTSHSQWLFNS